MGEISVPPTKTMLHEREEMVSTLLPGRFLSPPEHNEHERREAKLQSCRDGQNKDT